MYTNTKKLLLFYIYKIIHWKKKTTISFMIVKCVLKYTKKVMLVKYWTPSQNMSPGLFQSESSESNSITEHCSQTVFKCERHIAAWHFSHWNLVFASLFLGQTLHLVLVFGAATLSGGGSTLATLQTEVRRLLGSDFEEARFTTWFLMSDIPSSFKNNLLGVFLPTAFVRWITWAFIHAMSRIL